MILPLPAMIVTAALWRWAGAIVGAEGRIRLAESELITHAAFALALAGEAVQWGEPAVWLRVVLALTVAYTFIGYVIVTVTSREDFWAKRRNRLAAALVAVPVAFVAAAWPDPAHYFLIFAAAVYGGSRQRAVVAIRERLADSEAMREKIVSLMAVAHNRDLTDRAA